MKKDRQKIRITKPHVSQEISIDLAKQILSKQVLVITYHLFFSILIINKLARDCQYRQRQLSLHQ